MYSFRGISSDGSIYQSRPLQIVGNHAHVEDMEDRIAWGNLISTTPPVHLGPEWHTGTTLFNRAINEARGSDLLNGVTPETWSPIGAINPSSFGAWSANERLFESMLEFGTDPRNSESRTSPRWGVDATFGMAGGVLSVGQRVITARIGDEVVGAMAFWGNAFIVPLKQGSTAAEISYNFQNHMDSAAYREIVLTLEEQIPDHPITQHLLWRLYTGENSQVDEGVSEAAAGLHPIVTGPLKTSGYLVGRLFLGVYRTLRRNRPDPTAKRRLRDHQRNDPMTAQACPSLSEAKAPQNVAIIVVHGTMASGVPLAREVGRILGSNVPIFRFEHDTWLPIYLNGKELAGHIRRLGLSKVLLISHSRGGLVSRSAFKELTHRPPTPVIHSVSLGTPYRGTPMAALADGGLLGVNSFLGMIRIVPGAAVVDVATRISGLLLKTTLPRGIEAMKCDSEHINDFPVGSLMPGLTAIGGALLDDDSTDRYSIAKGVLSGFSLAAFQGYKNDMVVSFGSAVDAADGPRRHEVACDHFSFFSEQKVISIIKTLATQTFPEFSSAQSSAHK